MAMAVKVQRNDRWGRWHSATLTGAESDLLGLGVGSGQG